jgi:transposase
MDAPRRGELVSSPRGGEAIKTVSTIGLDIAKQVFQVHGADKSGRQVLRRKLRSGELVSFFTALPPCLIGIEASGSAHYWARALGGLGHTVRLMAPQFVKPYVKSQKNDANDAEAICEAVTRPAHAFRPSEIGRAAGSPVPSPGP